MERPDLPSISAQRFAGEIHAKRTGVILVNPPSARVSSSMRQLLSCCAYGAPKLRRCIWSGTIIAAGTCSLTGAGQRVTCWAGSLVKPQEPKMVSTGGHSEAGELAGVAKIHAQGCAGAWRAHNVPLRVLRAERILHT